MDDMSWFYASWALFSAIWLALSWAIGGFDND